MLVHQESQVCSWTTNCFAKESVLVHWLFAFNQLLAQSAQPITGSTGARLYHLPAGSMAVGNKNGRQRRVSEGDELMFSFLLQEKHGKRERLTRQPLSQ